MNDSLDTLLADGIIEAVIGQLKTGKEAEVWLVQHAGQVVAAKLYKERHERNFRNNVGYREGREVRNSRTRRAMEKGSRFGQAAAEEAWKSAEADSLYKLHAQGVRVPTPVMFYEGILLMELVVDPSGHPAPRLVELPPATPEEAEAMYVDLRSQVVRTLCADLIHGDLSPYNILMSWAGPTIIDFPQTVAAARNNRAEFYFRRDLDNVRDFLAGFSPRLRGTAGDTGEIWNAYVRRELTPEFVPSGTFREAPRRNGPPGRNGARPERANNGPGRPSGFRAEPAARERPPPAPAPDATPLDAEEAELRALEALVLRQGGGERSRPPVMSGPRDGRKRSFSGNRNGPRPGGNTARPPPAGGPRNAGGPSRPGKEQRGPGNGARPAGSEQRGPGNGARAPGNEQRGPGNGRPPVQAEARGGPRSPNGEQRNGANGRPPQNGQRNGGPRPPRDEQRVGGPMNGPRADGNPRPPRDEQRSGGPMTGPRAEGAPRPPRDEQRSGGPMNGPRSDGASRPPRDEQRARGPMNGPRGDGAPRPPRDGQRDGGNSRPPRGERRDGPSANAPPGAPSQPRAAGAREPRSGGPGNNGGGPRMPRQGADRGGPRQQRSGPQVSYVGRPATSNMGSPETGS